MLKYALRENLLTAEPDDYMAQAADARSYSLDEIIDLMMQRGTTVTKTDVTAVLQVYGEVVSSLVADGASINTPLINTSLSISGVFKGAADSFDRARHSVNLNITAGTLLKKAVPAVKTEKTEAVSTAPYITEVTDIVSGSVNTAITAGGILQAAGARLAFDAHDETQGLFLVPESGADAVRCSIVAENKPARVMVMIPSNLAAGTYYAELRTKLNGSLRPSKTLKTGRFEKPLSVTA